VCGAVCCGSGTASFWEAGSASKSKLDPKSRKSDPDPHQSEQCFGSRLDPDSIRSVGPDPNPGGQKCLRKMVRKKEEISCIEVLDVLF
jgi:hypothetical protein